MKKKSKAPQGQRDIQKYLGTSKTDENGNNGDDCERQREPVEPGQGITDSVEMTRHGNDGAGNNFERQHEQDNEENRDGAETEVANPITRVKSCEYRRMQSQTIIVSGFRKEWGINRRLEVLEGIGRRRNWKVSQKTVEEYEVQLVFNSKNNKVSKLIFHRIDVRITDEATLKVQQAINESIVSLNNQQLQQQLNRSSRANTQDSATSSCNYNAGLSSGDESNDESNDDSGDDSDVVTGNDADVFAGIESLSKKNSRNRSRIRSADSQCKGTQRSAPATLEEVVAAARENELELWKTTSRQCGRWSVQYCLERYCYVRYLARVTTNSVVLYEVGI
jgi:hypothetical protein